MATYDVLTEQKIKANIDSLQAEVTALERIKTLAFSTYAPYAVKQDVLRIYADYNRRVLIDPNQPYRGYMDTVPAYAELLTLLQNRPGGLRREYLSFDIERQLGYVPEGLEDAKFKLSQSQKLLNEVLSLEGEIRAAIANPQFINTTTGGAVPKYTPALKPLVCNERRPFTTAETIVYTTGLCATYRALETPEILEGAKGEYAAKFYQRNPQLKGTPYDPLYVAPKPPIKNRLAKPKGTTTPGKKPLTKLKK